MPVKYVLKKVGGGKFRFSLHGRDGTLIVTSPTYETKVAAKNGIRALQRNVNAEIEDQTLGVDGRSMRGTGTAKRTAAKATDVVRGAAKKAGETGTGRGRRAAAVAGAAAAAVTAAAASGTGTKRASAKQTTAKQTTAKRTPAAVPPTTRTRRGATAG